MNAQPLLAVNASSTFPAFLPDHVHISERMDWLRMHPLHTTSPPTNVHADDQAIMRRLLSMSNAPCYLSKTPSLTELQALSTLKRMSSNEGCQA